MFSFEKKQKFFHFFFIFRLKILQLNQLKMYSILLFWKCPVHIHSFWTLAKEIWSKKNKYYFWRNSIYKQLKNFIYSIQFSGNGTMKSIIFDFWSFMSICRVQKNIQNFHPLKFSSIFKDVERNTMGKA